MKDKLLTVIVPMYNASTYINNCIESILRQTYKNIEIILINDGSTDNTELICKKYQQIDSRIVLINQENKGVSIARNLGLNNANGEYITFIDSDDTIERDTYQIVLNKMNEQNADIGIFKYRRYDSYTNNSIEYGISEEKSYTFPEILEDYLSLNDYKKLGEANWNKVFRKNCIKNIKFKTIRIGEDFLFNYEAFKNASKIVNIPLVLYNYYINNNSATLSEFNKGKLIEYIESRKEVLNDVCKNYSKYSKNAFICMCDTYYYSILKFLEEKNLRKEKDFIEILNMYKELYGKELYEKLYKGTYKDIEIKNVELNYKSIMRKRKLEKGIKKFAKMILPKKIVLKIKKG